ncbi:hypothetical protein, partial [Nostoc sp.]|uniref:hypothetical protein n=1 Tax=Nostoc sp. TaxID=1180 RepID=UPI002FF61176
FATPKVSFEVTFVAFATPKVSFEVTFVAFATPKVSFEVTFVAFATSIVSFKVTFVAFATSKVILAIARKPQSSSLRLCVSYPSSNSPTSTTITHKKRVRINISHQ